MNLEDFGIPTLTKHCNELLILSILDGQRKHGYQIALDLEQESDGFFKFNHGTLYPILHKLEKGGIIRGVWKQEGPKRKRKYYTLTARGKKYILLEKDHWDSFLKKFIKIVGDLNP